MRQLIYIFGLLLVLSCESKKPVFAPADRFRMSRPIVRADSCLFKNTAKISLNFEFPNALVHYTTDGSDVTEDSPVYTKPLTLTTSAKVKAKVFHPNFLPSEQTELAVLRVQKNISDATIHIDPNPNADYSGTGTSSLTDLQKGSLQFKTGKKWLGFQNKVITIGLKLKEPLTLSKIYVSTLIDQNAWIFSPKSITISSNGIEVGKVSINKAQDKEPAQLKYIEVPITSQQYSTIDLQIHSLASIPEWHDGKGTAPWLFIDELIVE